MKVAAIIVSIASLLFWQIKFAFANPSNLISEIRVAKEGVVDAESKRRQLLSSLYAIEARKKKISDKKAKLQDELLQAEDLVNSKAAAIKSIEDQIKKQRRVLKVRMRILYKSSAEEAMNSVFGNSSSFEFDSALRQLKLTADFDYQLIQNYRGNVSRLAVEKKKLKSHVEHLLVVQKKVKRQEDLLMHEQKSQQDLVATIESKTKNELMRLRAMRTQIENSQSLDGQLAQFLRPSLFERKGTLLAPAKGAQLLTGFGLTVDPQFKFKIAHKGWRIRMSTANKEIYAIDDGYVIFDSALAGYGRTIIIDHEDHYYSIYAHVDAGPIYLTSRRVRSGEVLGRAEAELYFELRHFSEPEDPNLWIKPDQRILSLKTTEEINQTKIAEAPNSTREASDVR